MFNNGVKRKNFISKKLMLIAVIGILFLSACGNERTISTHNEMESSEQEYCSETELLEINQGDTELVSDAFSDTIIDSTGNKYCYHIPQVNLNKKLGSEINSQIYQQLNSILDKEVYVDTDDEKYYPFLSKMVYAWGKRRKSFQS